MYSVNTRPWQTLRKIPVSGCSPKYYTYMPAPKCRSKCPNQKNGPTSTRAHLSGQWIDTRSIWSVCKRLRLPSMAAVIFGASTLWGPPRIHSIWPEGPHTLVDMVKASLWCCVVFYGVMVKASLRCCVVLCSVLVKVSLWCYVVLCGVMWCYVVLWSKHPYGVVWRYVVFWSKHPYGVVWCCVVLWSKHFYGVVWC